MSGPDAQRVERQGWENVTLVESAVEGAAIPAEAWNQLESLVADLRVEPPFLGGAYLAWGTAPRSGPAPEPA